MFTNRGTRLAIVAAFALLVLACDIEEDLRLRFDGSGTYRIRIAIPKNLADGFGDLRKQAETQGFTVASEGTTDTERFIVLHKEFSDISSLNDDHSRFELTITERGLLRREYQLRATLRSVGFGTYQRHLAVTMPGKITSASSGRIDGSRVQWDTSGGGTIEIAASGFVFPLSRNQRVLAIAVAILGIAILIYARRRRGAPQPAVCANCQSPIGAQARFCGTCGSGAPAAQA